MGDSRQRSVARGMAAAASELKADFVLLLGDNIYPEGVASADDPLWQSAFVEPFSHPSLDLPFYPVLGNHDYAGNEQAQVGWAGDPRWRMPARYHSFSRELSDGTAVAFVLIDTLPLTLGPARKARKILGADEQLAWLEATLAGISADWILAAGHHPLLSGGPHGSDALLALQLAPLFERYGVDIYMAGHDHYQAWIPSGRGWVHLISGAGSNPVSVRWTPQTVAAHAGLGFTRLRIESHRVWIEFRSHRGEVLSRQLLEREPSQ